MLYAFRSSMLEPMCCGVKSHCEANADPGYVCTPDTQVGISEEKDFSTELSILNYPNPVRGETTFALQVPTSGCVSLMVFNVQGQELADIVDEWNPDDEQGR